MSENQENHYNEFQIMTVTNKSFLSLENQKNHDHLHWHGHCFFVLFRLFTCYLFVQCSKNKQNFFEFSNFERLKRILEKKYNDLHADT